MTVGRSNSRWLTWPSAFRSSRYDSRFSFCFHLPSDPARVRGLLVLVHGSEREAMAARDAFKPFAEENDVALLAPLFPISPLGDDNPDGYKFIVEGAIRYDRVLLSMIEEMAPEFSSNFARFMLFGFSGGAVFAQLFSTLHARCLSGCCFAAPGHSVFWDEGHPWPFGIRDVRESGLVEELADTHRMPIKLLVGSQDTEELPRRDPDYGRTRPEKLARLLDHYRDRAFDVDLEIVAGADHEWQPMVSPACRFFGSALQSMSLESGTRFR